MEKGETEVFFSNLKGSAAANVLTAVFFIIFWVLKNKCKHSRCASHTRFCTCSVKEDDDLERGQREERKAEITRQETLKIPGQAKENMRKLHIRVHNGLLSKREAVIPFD